MEHSDLLSDEDKVASLQAATGLDDPLLCSEILSAHNWDLPLALSALSSPPPQPRSLPWKLAALPFHAVSAGLSLASWIAGGVLSRSLAALGLPAEQVLPSAEAAELAAELAAEYGIEFAAAGFTDALQKARREFRPLFVYLHSPDHPDTPAFCYGCLRDEAVVEFVNENFVIWCGSIRRSEGFKVGNLLKASRFPFCAIVSASDDQRITLLRQIEGAASPGEMLSILQQVVEETGPTLGRARIEAEERMANIRLREEQDAAYHAALEADRAREEHLEREAAEAERKRREEEDARDRAAREAAEKEASLGRRRQEKATSLGMEPEKSPDVTQVLVRFPSGERAQRRFHCSSTIKSLYDYVDSLESSKAEKYNLVSNFPRVSYGLDKHSLTLKEAGLHPQASLFVEVEEARE